MHSRVPAAPREDESLMEHFSLHFLLRNYASQSPMQIHSHSQKGWGIVSGANKVMSVDPVCVQKEPAGHLFSDVIMLDVHFCNVII